MTIHITLKLGKIKEEGESVLNLPKYALLKHI